MDSPNGDIQRHCYEKPPHMAAAAFEVGKFEEKCTQTQHQNKDEPN